MAQAGTQWFPHLPCLPMAGMCHHRASPPYAILMLASQQWQWLQWSDRRLLGRVATRLAPLPLVAGLRCRLDAKGLASSVDHAAAPSLAMSSARQSRAAPPYRSSSYSASIILRRQIVPCSAYSAEQSSHDCSVRRVQAPRVLGCRKRHPRPFAFASGYDLGVLISAFPHWVDTRIYKGVRQ
jgi:hypothetical protein